MLGMHGVGGGDEYGVDVVRLDERGNTVDVSCAEFAGEGDGSWLVDVIQRDDRRTGDEAGEIQCMGGTDVADSDNANT